MASETPDPVQLNITEDAQNGLNYLLSLDAEGYKRLIHLLEKVPEDSSNFGSYLAKAGKFDSKVIGGLLSAMVLGFAVVDYEKKTLEEATLEITANLQEKNPDAVELFKKFFPDILRQKATTKYALRSKAFSLIWQYDKTFLASSIATDIRPVFDFIDERAKHAMILHQLRISYRDGDNDKEIFLTLDNTDLSKLRRVIDRAEAKYELLTKLYPDTELISFR